MPALSPPQQPTFYFVGVSTGQSSSRRVFPRWMEALGRPEVVLQGVDFPLHDDPANYRAFVEFVRREPKAAAQGIAQLAHWYAEGKVKPAIDCKLPMSELRAAYARMGTRQVMGKVLLVND